MEQVYFTLKQATKLLQVSESTIRRGIKKGDIPKARFCGKVLIPSWFFKEAQTGRKENVIEAIYEKW